MAWLKLLRFPKSLRWRYSLRALLLFITLFMIWGGYHTNRSWNERHAERILAERGASFAYWTEPSGSTVWSNVQFGYRKIVEALWRERSIKHVTLNSPPDLAAVQAIVALPSLESLDLWAKPSLTDEERAAMQKGILTPYVKMPEGALPELLSQVRLRSLSLSQWFLNDEDLRAIGEHDSLEGLSIVGSTVSEDGFANVLTLPRLRGFMCTYCQVRGDRLATVPGSRTLEWADTLWTPVGDEFAAFVGRSPNVYSMNTTNMFSEPDDEFVEAIGRHPTLNSLSLPFGSLTDKSADLIAKMPALRKVLLPANGISSEAIARLHKDRPDIVVDLHGTRVP
jgi:hypothetical protein